MIYNWLAIINAIISEHPELFPAIVENDLKDMSKKEIQFEQALFKWLQERYEYCTIYGYPDICAIIQAFILDDEFYYFAYSISWLMEQPEKEGGLECTDYEYAIDVFYHEMIGEDELKEAITDSCNYPTPTELVRMGYEYRFYMRYADALSKFNTVFKEHE